MSRHRSTDEHSVPASAVSVERTEALAPPDTIRSTLRILIVENDLLLVRALVRSLRRAQFEAVVATDPIEGIRRWRSDRFVAALIDWKLGSDDGLCCARHLRELAPGAAILMMSGYAKSRDICRALDVVDDYVTKPFAGSELIARIRATIRRSSGGPAQRSLVPIDHGCLLDVERSCLITPDRMVPLARGELTMLHQLGRARGVWHTTSDLAKALGRSDAEGRLLAWQYISKLRSKLGVASQAVEHARNRGYRLR